MGFASNLASSIGTTVPALILATTLFSGYLFAYIYRKAFHNKPAQTQWLYFAISGFGLIVFNYGVDAYHSLISVLIVWALCHWLPGTGLSVIIAFTFLMTHLSLGYWYMATDDYDIDWTIPQCILTLRLIGLVWDLYDGRQPEETLSEDQKETAVKDAPSLLEISAFTFFFGSFLVGPQYPLVRFRKFVNGEFSDPKTGKPRDSLYPTLLRLVPGLFYMVAHFYFFINYLPTEYFLTDEFKNESFFWKYVHIMLWMRFLLFKYQACWLVTEGSCILSGLAYNGVHHKTGKVLWDGVRNIRLTKFEFGCNFQSLVESFNCNTNQWAARYVFKRLKFLGNKSASHLLTLAFLALWHGLYSGYFVCFFFEFVCVLSERKAGSVINKFPKLKHMATETWMFYPCWVIRKLIVMQGLTFGLLPFALLTFERWLAVYKDLYFFGYVFYFVLWLIMANIKKSR